MFTTYFKSTLLAFLLLSVSIFAQNSQLNEHAVKFESSTTVSLVGENGLIMRSTDRGLTWNEQQTNISNVLFGTSINNGISLAAGENGVILRSVDNGTTWDPILPGTTENLNDIELLEGTAVVCGNNGVIYYSDDAGLTWNPAVTNTTKNLRDVNFLNAMTGYAAGELGTLLKTEDGGQSWTTMDMSFTTRNFNSVEAVNEFTAAVVGDEGTAFMTNDGGISWYGPSILMTENDFNEVVFFNDNEGVIAGDNGMMLKTDDGGYSWQSSTVTIAGESNDLNSVAFYDAQIGVAVGSDGLEIYSTDGGVTWVEESPNYQIVFGSKRQSVTLEQNYPNPFNPSTNINYNLPSGANVTLKVYDIAGREVANLFSGYQNTGSHSVRFDAAGLASGVYFYKLSVQNGADFTTKVNKMILTK
ncbi:MAG TPA: YCF48-related protein [Ignavibacteria bacterium]|nr:YCF48-related protein [Ignavibacteria bacterium]HRF67220.1 YCF48-related protein [Ignavibacteria bacterium]HRJ03125.1 YCF48-related protein [Ignavibacteria bacterium]